MTSPSLARRTLLLVASAYLLDLSPVRALLPSSTRLGLRRATAPPPLRRPVPPPSPLPVPFRPSFSDDGSSTALNGIPKMFRWLTDQYPSIQNRLSEGLRPSRQVDAFYLDMNGIIHPCTHNNDKGSVVILDEVAMFKKIFGYVDRLYRIVRPRKILYLAVDGVAPRAKMNQQRSRRFRSSKEAEETLAQLVARGQEIADRSDTFDSNCITPGTDFMLKLNLAFQKWIEFKQRTDPFWRDGATVIFSGPDVEGEGEHKVMDFIREKDPSWYEEGMTHCLYGLDADLIMLGLVTHEKNFVLLREKMSVVMGSRRGGQKKDMLNYGREDFELLELSVLREMMSLQFTKFRLNNDLGFKFDLDRVIDDFVFMCMLVGNDFLPHGPHLDIASGALSQMLTTYTDLLSNFGGYLTEKEKIHPERLTEFLQVLAITEEHHFHRRGQHEKEEAWKVPADAKHSPSYKDFYYQSKLDWDPDDVASRRACVRDYLEGLHWVLHYYHNGCQSWAWYFPHLYAPLVSDMTDLGEFYAHLDRDPEGFVALPFELGTPLEPLVQLLSVLSPQSSDLLPGPYGDLMLNSASPVADYYPPDFTTDPNGKRQPWESVVQIPFIDKAQLDDAVATIVHDDLSAAEKRRNVRGAPQTFDPPREKPWEECWDEWMLGGGGARTADSRRRPGRSGQEKGRGRRAETNGRGSQGNFARPKRQR